MGVGRGFCGSGGGGSEGSGFFSSSPLLHGDLLLKIGIQFSPSPARHKSSGMVYVYMSVHMYGIPAQVHAAHL